MEQAERRQLAKRYLSRYRDLRREETQLIDQISHLWERMDLSAVALTGMPKGSAYYGTDDFVADLDELRESLDTAILEAVVAYRDIEIRIDAIEDPLHRTILRGHYLAGQTLTLLADQLGYSVPRLLHLHGEALDAFPLPDEVSTPQRV